MHHNKASSKLAFLLQEFIPDSPVEVPVLKDFAMAFLSTLSVTACMLVALVFLSGQTELQEMTLFGLACLLWILMPLPLIGSVLFFRYHMRHSNDTA